MTRRTARFIRRYAATPSGARYRHPSRLFGVNDVGAVYLPGDLTRYFQGGQIVATPSMYQDSAGTTPVTAVGQPVGLRLDVKSGAVQLGAELVATSNVVLPSNVSYVIGPALSPSKLYRVQVAVTNFSGTGDLGFDAPTFALIYGSTRFTGNAVASSIVAGAGGPAITVFSRTTNSATLSNISVREVIGTHQIQPSATSRPVLVASGGGYALQYDGVDDGSYSASTLNLTGTDKVTVLAAVRKLSDATTAMVIESSANGVTEPGTFFLSAPSSSGVQSIAFSAQGTSRITAGNYALASPVTAQICASGSISAGSVVFRTNGQLTSNPIGSLGTGNYGNHTLYIGRRNNSSLPFNGLEYGIVIIGRLLTERERKTAENWLARASGVTLP